MEDHCTKLNQYIQKTYGKNIKWLPNEVTGQSHCPEITVTLEMPNNEKYSITGASGENQKSLKQELCKKILEELTN